MDRVAGPTWQKQGEVRNADMRPDGAGCVSVKTSWLRA